MVRPTIEEFSELGRDLDRSLGKETYLKKLYDELNLVKSIRGVRGTYTGISRLVQIYFPDKEEIFFGTIKIKENRDRRTEALDANIIFQNYLHKHDTRDPPVFFSTMEYESAERAGKLEPKIEIFRVLTRDPILRYYIHKEGVE